MELAVVAVAAALAAQRPSAERVEAALKDTAVCTYRLLENGARVGTMTVRVATETVNGRRRGVFTEEMEWKTPDDQKARMTFKETTDARDLRLLSAVYNDTSYEWSVDVEERRARFTGGGAKDRTVAVSDATVGMVTLLRMVGSAEQKEGATFKVDVVNIVARQYQPEHTVRCVGKEPVDVGGKPIEAFKWEDRWESTVMRDGEPRTLQFTEACWVGADGRILRFRRGGFDAVLEVK